MAHAFDQDPVRSHAILPRNFSTATTIPAPESRATFTGTGLTIPPSTSVPPSWHTGRNSPGTEMLAQKRAESLAVDETRAGNGHIQKREERTPIERQPCGVERLELIRGGEQANERAHAGADNPSRSQPPLFQCPQYTHVGPPARRAATERECETRRRRAGSAPRATALTVST